MRHNLYDMPRQLQFAFMNKVKVGYRHSDSDKQDWAKWYQTGMSFREIAKKFDVPYPTVFHCVRKELKITDGRQTGRKKVWVDLTKPEVVRQNLLKRVYGMSLEEYKELFDSQNGVCAICGEKAKGGKTSTRELHIDHDHVTGRNRGLLCHKCNPGLGQFNDSIEMLEKAIAYLKKYQSSS